MSPKVVNDRVVSLATSQHGVVARRQLSRAGLSDSAIALAVRRGRLLRLHQGVYAVGHRALTAQGWWMAAVLACGDGAVLSHATAGAAWDLRSSNTALIHVIVPTAGGRARHRGLRIHRRPDLRSDETTHLGAIPITTPARTLLDLAARLPRPALERALERAEAQRIVDHADLTTLLLRRRSQPGARKLASLEITDEPALTRSELEDRFLELLPRHDLPRPLTNHRVLDYEVDFVWPERRLIVETDGHRHHGTRQAFERDRRRDARLQRAGYAVLRFTYRQVIEAPEETVATVRELLRQRARHETGSTAQHGGQVARNRGARTPA